jgi:hypothetical protein
MSSTICAAIRNRAVITFSYGGGTRTVEPHCHGTSLANNEVLRAWQTQGYSSSGHHVGWKLFEVSQIVGLSTTEVRFSSNRPNYNPSDRGMKVVHCHV